MLAHMSSLVQQAKDDRRFGVVCGALMLILAISSRMKMKHLLAVLDLAQDQRLVYH